MTDYAELAVTTNFSFLRGASHPQEMVAAADALRLSAIGIADRNSFAGVVRAFHQWKALEEARERGERQKVIKLLVGVRLVTLDAFEVLAYPTDRTAYGRLCRLLTDGNRLAKKAECFLSFERIIAASEGQILIALPPSSSSTGDNGGEAQFGARLRRLAEAAPGRTFLGAVHRHRGDEPRRLALLNEFGERCGAPIVAINDVHYHAPERKALADIVTCIREKCTINDAGFRLSANAERHLKPANEMRRLFSGFEDAVARSVTIADACSFSLGEMKNQYPDEPVPPGKTPALHLHDLVFSGAKGRYPAGIPQNVAAQLEEELELIQRLEYERYFLTVHDVVAFARSKKILCQGRGSAANSAVCYCLGITEINPSTTKLLFARFISEKRDEPPDIDVDFEHERREEVIQYVYSRYGRDRAAICATVIHYRSRRAIREVGKALGLTPDITGALAKTVWGWSDKAIRDEHIRQLGLDPENPLLRQAIDLAGALIGFPRHLSQHVGGFVLTRDRLDETVPIGNAAMKDRTFIEWDKDDIDTLGLMKVDVLALGMLSCIRRALDFLKSHYGLDTSMAEILQKDDPAVYDMLCRADSVGVFQVESRAQMSMLPRLRPRVFYDLVIEVAIVRPGPIQGDMVHPYLKRRENPDAVSYPSPHQAHGHRDELKEVLCRTLGVPLFQEQAMQIAITAAKFTPDEADGLRRAMATFRHTGTVHTFREKFVGGMVRRGYDPNFATACFNQIEGFGEYGFPESHAASFALLVYVSAWIKCHYPDVFCAAILNSQPMGFYQPAQLVRDARVHGVDVREADVNFSDWDTSLEPTTAESDRSFAVRLGLRQISGLHTDEASALIAARSNGYQSLERLATLSGVSRFFIERLAEADAFRSLGMDRRAALWAARRLGALGIAKAKAVDSPPSEETRPRSLRRRSSRRVNRLHGNQAEGFTTIKSVRMISAKSAADTLPLFAEIDDALFPEPQVELPAMPLSEHVVEDYVTTGLSLKAHPVAFFREKLTQMEIIRNSELRKESLTQNRRVTVSGLVLNRQQPGTAQGVVFATLEDETDIANIIIWPKIFEKYRLTAMTSRFLAVRGRVQRAGLVVHVLAENLIDLTPQLRLLRDGELLAASAPPPAEPDIPLQKSRDFH